MKLFYYYTSNIFKSEAPIEARIGSEHLRFSVRTKAQIHAQIIGSEQLRLSVRTKAQIHAQLIFKTEAPIGVQ